VEQAAVSGSVPVDDHTFRIGTIAGVPVIIGATGIGLVNAAATTQALLAQFTVRGIVFSGVAGSALQIGDVAVPDTWELADGTTYPATPEWLNIIRQLAGPGHVTLDDCTVPANQPMHAPVCFPDPPAIAVGGLGRSSDPFGGMAFKCQAGGNDVFGCDAALGEPLPEGAPVVEDMETAAVAREAAARHIPFIGFRAVSDGSPDPLGLSGFPGQFFAYYRFAAHNAAAAAAAFLQRLGAP